MSLLYPEQPVSEHDEEQVVLLLQVPRTNEKKELAAEQMFASLHGLLHIPPKNRFYSARRMRISFEIAVLHKRIGFYVSAPRFLKDYIQEQLYAQYPNVQISEVPDFSRSNEVPYPATFVSELKLTNNNALPIKTFLSFEVDPLAAITATLAKFEENEEAWIQLILQPAQKNWHKGSERYVTGMKTGGSSGSGGLLNALWTPPDPNAKDGAAKLTEFDQARVRAAEEKSHKLAYEASLRIVYRGQTSESQAKLRLQSIVASYKQFNTTYLNGFEQGKLLGAQNLAQYQNRALSKKPLILNIEEVATLYHLPHTNVETPYILWSSSQTGEPPANLPVATPETKEIISPIAVANFRGHNTAFGMPRSDRGRHLYVLGQTGVGKSGLLELLTIADIDSPYGFAIIDPHGDYALNILRRIPAERSSDVIYFNPADAEFPIAFNPMEVTDPNLRTHTVSELIGVLKRMFDSWGPRLEYILRYSLLALSEYPDATMLDITRILTDKAFRRDVLKNVSDPVVRNFWEVEFSSWNDKFAAEAVAPVLNKVGAFTANPIVRNIIGQPKSSFNIRKIMDERKILIVNLNRGLVGEDNAALLGALLVTKVQLGAMSRADVPASERIPFYLYVDEFQHFATDSFATILSEARKYALNLTVANQYIAQMSQEVKDAVFGNVGSMIAFRMGADDARSMQRYFEPRFTEYDLVHMHNRHLIVTMTIQGEKTPAFSAITLDLPEPGVNNTEQIINNSRELYARPRTVIESEILHNYHDAPVPSSAFKQPGKKSDNSRVQHATAPVQGQPEPRNPELEPITFINKDEDVDKKLMPEKKKAASETVGKAVRLGLELTSIKPKRKRKRTRKRKTVETPQNTSAAPAKDPTTKVAPPPKKDDKPDEEVIYLR